MKSQNAPTMPERRKLLVAGAGIAAASLIPPRISGEPILSGRFIQTTQPTPFSSWQA